MAALLLRRARTRAGLSLGQVAARLGAIRAVLAFFESFARAPAK